MHDAIEMLLHHSDEHTAANSICLLEALTVRGLRLACWMAQQDKNYAFVEFRSVEEASNCMSFDGVAFKDGFLKVRALLIFWLLRLLKPTPPPFLSVPQRLLCRGERLFHPSVDTSTQLPPPPPPHPAFPLPAPKDGFLKVNAVSTFVLDTHIYAARPPFTVPAPPQHLWPPYSPCPLPVMAFSRCMLVPSIY